MERVAVRAGTRVVVEGRRAPGVELAVRLEGGGSLEMVGPSGVGDRLRAQDVRIDIGKAPPGQASPLFGSARVAARPKPRASAAGSPAAERTARPATRWTLESHGLEMALADEQAEPKGFGMRRFEATGGVVARTDDHRVEGDRLSFDGKTGLARVFGGPREMAALQLGQGEGSQRAWAREMEVSLADGRPSRALLRAPATVVLLRKPDEGKTVVERLELRAEGDVTIVPSQAETRGRTALTRTTRERAGAAFEKPATLWTPHLVVEGSNLLGEGKAALRRVLARGAGTRFESGDLKADGLSAVGDFIRYDAETSLVRIEDSRRVLLERGTGRAEARSLTYDLKTGLYDFDSARMVFGGK
jgi:lipopolysaccharide export system protein LptA